MPAFPLVFSTLSLFALSACGGRNDPATVPATANCRGQQMAIVTNDWNEPVEVYARQGDDARANSLGRVSPGERIEFTLPNGVRQVYPAQVVSRSYTPPEMRQLVRIRYVCR